MTHAGNSTNRKRAAKAIAAVRADGRMLTVSTLVLVTIISLLQGAVWMLAT